MAGSNGLPGFSISDEKYMKRRNFLRSAVLLGAGSALQRAWAQAYPGRPIKIVVGFGAGGSGDVTMRIAAEKLAPRLGQSVVVENRPGAGGITAAQQVLQSKSDGYTLMLGASSNMAMLPTLFKNVPFDTSRDFAPVSLVAKFGFLIAVNSSLKIASVADLIREAKANPGKINIGSITIGSAPHVGVELFKSVAGIDCVTVPFKSSGEVVSAVRSGEVQVALDNIPPLLPHVQSGALRAIAMTTAARFPLLPDVPTVLESGLNYEMTSWNGIVAPKGTPTDILDLLNREVRAVVEMPDVIEKYRAIGVVATGSTRQEYQSLIDREIIAWRKILEIAKVQAN